MTSAKKRHERYLARRKERSIKFERKPKADIPRGLKKWEEFNRASLNFNNGGQTQRLRANVAEGINRTKVIQSWIWEKTDTPKIHLTGVLDK